MSKIFNLGGPKAGWARPGEPSGFRSPAEREAMTEGLKGLIDILSWSRPHGSITELEFLKSVVLPAIKGAGRSPLVDGFGNIWVDVPRPEGAFGPSFLWSCHVDTVASQGGRQGVRYRADGRTLELSKKSKKPGRCLGADDGAGVWLLLEMLKAGVPGGYVFHRGEECGRLGSEYVAKHEPERLKPYDSCVAFDRRGYADLITHQMGLRCASRLFAETFSKSLNTAGHGFAYEADDTGSYTDSYSYAELVSECANVSVGYDMEHGPRETLDGLHVWRLREAMLSADFSGVVCERDPSAWEDDIWGYGVPYGTSWGSSPGSRTGAKAWQGSLVSEEEERQLDKRETLVDLIRRYPRAVADLLGVYGLGEDELFEHMTDSELAGAMPLSASAGGWHHD